MGRQVVLVFLWAGRRARALLANTSYTNHLFHGNKQKCIIATVGTTTALCQCSRGAKARAQNAKFMWSWQDLAREYHECLQKEVCQQGCFAKEVSVGRPPLQVHFRPAA